MTFPNLRMAFLMLTMALTGCNSAELSGFQKQLSGLNTAMGPVYHKATLPADREKVSSEATVPVDVDTAAARLKRYYRFTQTRKSAHYAIRAQPAESGLPRPLSRTLTGLRNPARTTVWGGSGGTTITLPLR
jgi:hypothetical protein